MMDLAVGRLSLEHGDDAPGVEAVSPHVSSIFNTAMFVGEAMGPILGGAWISHVGWGFAFASLGATWALFAIIFVIVLGRSRDFAPGSPVRSRAGSEDQIEIRT